MREDLAVRLARYRQVKNGPPRHILLDGSDQRLDRTGNASDRVNAWPVRCDHCTLPDLDFVPSPYRIAKGTASTADLALADLGNLFVKERVKRVLERVASDCRFYRAVHAKTGDDTDWWLAVPVQLVKTADIDASVPRCPRCGEPKVAHPGSHFRPCDVPAVSAEVFKSAQWSSSNSIAEEIPRRQPKSLAAPAPKAPKHQWTRLTLDRDLWLSVRLWELFKKLKFKSLRRDIDCDQRLTAEDRQWVEEQLAAVGQGNGSV
jgi:hypothetical protein